MGARGGCEARRAEADGESTEPWDDWPGTRYEAKAARAGRGAWYMTSRSVDATKSPHPRAREGQLRAPGSGLKEQAASAVTAATGLATSSANVAARSIVIRLQCRSCLAAHGTERERHASALRQQLLARQADDPAEAGDDVAALDLEAEEREIGEPRVARGVGMAREVARFASGSSSRVQRPVSVSRMPSSTRRPAAGSRTKSSEARGSRSRFFVCSASRDRSISGEPSAAGAVTT